MLVCVTELCIGVVCSLQFWLGDGWTDQVARNILCVNELTSNCCGTACTDIIVYIVMNNGGLCQHL